MIAMKQYTVAILGATGAVGQEMKRVLEERNFPVGKLKLLASTRSAGKTETYCGESLAVEEAKESAFRGVDLVLGAAENEIAQRFAPAIRAAGAVFVDNSSAFRLDPDVPPVVPEVNPEDAAHHSGIIANPNCTTIITVTAVAALNRICPIRSMVVSTYQAVSGAGVAGIEELHAQVSALEAGRPVAAQAFPHQIAYNLIPQIGGTQYRGYTSEEMKMQNEGRRILHLPELLVSCTCVRVPVIRSHSISATLRFARPLSVEEARAAMETAPAAVSWTRWMRGSTPCLWTHPPRIWSMWAGFARISPTLPALPVVLRRSDSQGAATNAVQIAELLFLGK